MTLYGYFQEIKDTSVEQLKNCSEVLKSYWQDRKSFAEKVLTAMTVEEAELELDILTSTGLKTITQVA